MAPRYAPEGPKAPRLNPENPGARTVDPYMRPPEESDLGRLSNALGNLAPMLGRFSEQAKADELARGEEQGRADFLEMKRTGLKIKNGEMNASGSRWYRRAYHESMGQLAATQYGGDLTKVVNDPASPMAHTTEPEAFDKFTAEQRSEWLKKHAGEPNADFLAGFNSTAVGVELNARTSFIAQANKRLEENTGKVYVAQVHTMISALRNDPNVPAGKFKEAVAFFVNKLRGDQYFLNPAAGSHLTGLTATALFDAAKFYEDPSILEIADQIHSGIPGAKLSATDEWRSKITEIRRGIRNDRQNRINFETAEEKRVRLDLINNVYEDLGKAFGAQGANAAIIDTRPFLERMSAVAPEKAEQLQGVIDAYRRGGTVIEDPAYLDQLRGESLEGTLTNDQIATAFAGDRISIKTADELRARVKANRAGGGSKALIQDPYFKAAEDDLQTALRNDKGFVGGQNSVRAMQDLRTRWIAYRTSEEGSKATPEQLSEWGVKNVAYSFALSKKSGRAGSITTIQKQKDAADASGQPVGPQPIKWEEGQVVGKTQFAALESEDASIRRQTRKEFSDANKQIITRYGLVRPDGSPSPTKIKAFLDKQRGFIASDSTSQ